MRLHSLTLELNIHPVTIVDRGKTHGGNINTTVPTVLIFSSILHVVNEEVHQKEEPPFVRSGLCFNCE